MKTKLSYLLLVLVPLLIGSSLAFQTYVLKDYTLVFETNGGTPIEPITGKFGTPLHLEITQEGFTFDGWDRDGYYFSNPYGPLNRMPAEDIKLYAKWNKVFSSISAGDKHSIAISKNGQVFGWGENSNGEIGNGGYSDKYIPALVNFSNLSSGETIAKVSSNGAHNLAITTQGRLYAWGWNLDSQLGDGTREKRNTPVPIQVSNLQEGERISEVSAGGYHSLALTTQGRLLAWGLNTDGRLGDGTDVNRKTPTLIFVPNLQSGEHIVQISARFNNSLALTNRGRVYAWGANYKGELGDGTTMTRTRPTLINIPNLQSGETIVQISTGGFIFHSFVITSAGRVYGWGANNINQLGDGTTTSRSTPKIINFPNLQSGEFITQINSSDHNLATTNQGRVYAWGLNNENQLGDGTNTIRSTPKLINFTDLYNDEKILKVSAGRSHSLTISSFGRIFAWGSDADGQSGEGLSSFSNVQKPTLIYIRHLQIKNE